MHQFIEFEYIFFMISQLFFLISLATYHFRFKFKKMIFGRYWDINIEKIIGDQ